MFSGKLYSVWIDGEPSPVLSVYHDDSEAISAFRSLIFSVRDDIDADIVIPGTDIKMSLYVHAYYLEDGLVRGLARPQCIMSGIDVKSESGGDCEVIED